MIRRRYGSVTVTLVEKKNLVHSSDCILRKLKVQDAARSSDVFHIQYKVRVARIFMYWLFALAYRTVGVARLRHSAGEGGIHQVDAGVRQAVRRDAGTRGRRTDRGALLTQ